MSVYDNIVFELCEGDITRIETAMKMKVLTAVRWVKNLRDKHEIDLEFQAAIHGIELKKEPKVSNGSVKPDFEKMKSGLLGIPGIKASFEKIKVS